jgi:hypothetical protein
MKVKVYSIICSKYHEVLKKDITKYVMLLGMNIGKVTPFFDMDCCTVRKNRAEETLPFADIAKAEGLIDSYELAEREADLPFDISDFERRLR